MSGSGVTGLDDLIPHGCSGFRLLLQHAEGEGLSLLCRNLSRPRFYPTLTPVSYRVPRSRVVNALVGIHRDLRLRLFARRGLDYPLGFQGCAREVVSTLVKRTAVAWEPCHSYPWVSDTQHSAQDVLLSIDLKHGSSTRRQMPQCCKRSRRLLMF